MKLHWVVPSLIGTVCLTAALPAEAGQLTAWQYKSGQNQLEFTTDEGVQPRAQLVFDPARLVIDLPGTTLGAVSTAQAIGGGIQQVRIGQLDEQTTRIVVQLSPGYTLDPGQIRFRGLSPTQWTVQLPSPQLANAAASSASDASNSSASTAPTTAGMPSTSVSPNSPNLDRAASATAPPVSRPPLSASGLTNPTFNSANSAANPVNPVSNSAPNSAVNPIASAIPNSPTSTAQSFPSPTSTISAASPPASPSLPASAPPLSARPVPAPFSPVRSPQLLPQLATQSVQSTIQSSQSSAALTTPTTTRVDAVQVADRGLLITTQGKAPEVAVNRSRNRRSITIQLANAQLSAQLIERERRINQLGIDRLTIRQNNTQVEMTLDVSRRSPDWQAQVNDQGGIVLIPVTEVAVEPKSAEPDLRSSLPAVTTAAPSNSVMLAEQLAPGRASANALPRTQLAMIQGIELDLSGNQLLIQTDRPVSHQAQWQSGMYVVTLSPAQLADRVTGPQLSDTAPLRRVRLRQVNSQTVTVLIQPAPGIQFGALNLITPQLLALEMQRPTARPVASVMPSASLNQPLPAVVPNGRVVVAIDPGHGGGDVGAVGIGGIHEADIVLSIAQQVARILQQQGIQAVLTRSSDVEIDLQPRVDTAEQAGANLFVSIHANSMGMDRPDINGIETYYYGSGAALAQTIQSSVVSGTGMQDRGIQQARFYVLRKSSMPAVLVETGFVTGSQDAAHLANSGFQNQMATAIARGILQYIQQQAMVGRR